MTQYKCENIIKNYVSDPNAVNIRSTWTNCNSECGSSQAATCSQGQQGTLQAPCKCGTSIITAGYCCNSNPQATSCGTNIGSCKHADPITPTSQCICQGAVRNSGVCCNNVWQSSGTCTSTTIPTTTTVKQTLDCNTDCSKPGCLISNAKCDQTAANYLCQWAINNDNSEYRCSYMAFDCSITKDKFKESITQCPCSQNPKSPVLNSIQQSRGDNKITLSWTNDCFADKYEIYRCKGTTCNDNQFTKISDDVIGNEYQDEILVESGATYFYKVSAYYKDTKISKLSNPKSVLLGDDICYKRSGTFCLKTDPKLIFECNENFRIIDNSLATDCGVEYCYQKDESSAICLPRVENVCEMCNNPLLAYGLEASSLISNSDGSLTSNYCRDYPSSTNPYCYYDYSSTVANKFYDCSKVESCYNYKSKSACEANKCLDETTGTRCTWNPISDALGTGICQEADESLQQCSLCTDRPFFNQAFTTCTIDICKKFGNCLPVDKNNDGILSKDNQEKCVGKNDVSCKDYPSEEFCIGKLNRPVKVDTSWAKDLLKFNGTNHVTQNSTDYFGIGLCKWGSNTCFKDADGNSIKDDYPQDTVPPQSTPFFINPIGSLKFDMEVQDFGRDNKPCEVDSKYCTGAKKLYVCFTRDSTKPCYPAKSQSGITIDIVDKKSVEVNLIGKPNANLNGDYYVYYFAEDGSNNLEVVKNTTITIDKTKPFVSEYKYYVNKTQSAPYDDSSVTIDFKVSKFATCSGSLEGGSKVPDPNNVFGNYFRAKFYELSDGTYPYKITCTDASGNTNSNDKPIDIKVNANPDVMYLNPPSKTNETDVNLSITTKNEMQCGYSTSAASTFLDSIPFAHFGAEEDGSYSQWSSLQLNNGQYTYYILCDQNNFVKQKNTFVVDRIVPVTRATDDLQIDYDFTKWAKTHSIYLQCTDQPQDGFDCDETRYCVSGQECEPKTTYTVSSPPEKIQELLDTKSSKYLCYSSNESTKEYSNGKVFGGLNETKTCKKVLIDSVNPRLYVNKLEDSKEEVPYVIGLGGISFNGTIIDYSYDTDDAEAEIEPWDVGVGTRRTEDKYTFSNIIYVANFSYEQLKSRVMFVFRYQDANNYYALVIEKTSSGAQSYFAIVKNGVFQKISSVITFPSLDNRGGMINITANGNTLGYTLKYEYNQQHFSNGPFTVTSNEIFKTGSFGVITSAQDSIKLTEVTIKDLNKPEQNKLKIGLNNLEYIPPVTSSNFNYALTLKKGLNQIHATATDIADNSFGKDYFVFSYLNPPNITDMVISDKNPVDPLASFVEFGHNATIEVGINAGHADDPTIKDSRGNIAQAYFVFEKGSKLKKEIRINLKNMSENKAEGTIWNGNISSENLTTGDHEYTLIAIDGFGRPSQKNFNITVKDTKIPEFKIRVLDSTTLKNVTVMGMKTYKVNLTCSEDATVTYLNLTNTFNQEVIIIYSPKGEPPRREWNGTFTVPRQYNFMNQQGDVTFHILAKDRSANPAVDEVPGVEGYQYRIDTMGPLPPIFEPSIDTASSTTPYNIIYPTKVQKYDELFYTNYSKLFLTGTAQRAYAIKVASGLIGQEQQISDSTIIASTQLGDSTEMGTLSNAPKGATVIRFSSNPLDPNIVKVGNYLGFNTHKRSPYEHYLENYKITAVNTQGVGTAVTIDPPLQEAVTTEALVTFYDAKYPPYWFGVYTKNFGQGLNTVSVAATNGVWGDATPEYEIFFDDKKPELVTIISPKPEFTVNVVPTEIKLKLRDSNPSSGIANATILIQNKTDPNIFETGTPSIESTAADGPYTDYTIAFDLGSLNLDIGKYDVTLIAYDKSGNKLISKYWFGYNDKTPAPPTFAMLDDNYQIKPNVFDLYTGTDDDGKYFSNTNITKFKLIFDTDVTIASIKIAPQKEITYTKINDKIYNFSINEKLSDGQYNITINASKKNEEAQADYNYGLIIDTKKPALSNLTFASPVNKNYPSFAINLTVNETKEDYAVNLSISQTKYADLVTNEHHIFYDNLHLPNLNDGSHSIKLQVADQAGNLDAITRDLTIDNTKPVITFNNLVPQEGTKIAYVDGDWSTDSYNAIANITIIDASDMNLMCYSNLQGNVDCETTAFRPKQKTELNMSIGLLSQIGAFIGNNITLFAQDLAINNGSKKIYVISDIAAPEIINHTGFTDKVTMPRPTIFAEFNERTIVSKAGIYRTDVEPIQKFDVTIEPNVNQHKYTFIPTKNIFDGEYVLNLTYKDMLNNTAGTENNPDFGFMVEIEPLTLNLTTPRYNHTSINPLDIVFTTNRNAQCKYRITSFPGTYSYANMPDLTSSTRATHKLANQEINGTSLPIYIICKDEYGVLSQLKFYDIVLDINPPRIDEAYFDPNPVVEYDIRPDNGNNTAFSLLTVSTNESAICKFSDSNQDFNQMKWNLNGTELNHYAIVERENEKTYPFTIKCQSLAGVMATPVVKDLNVTYTAPLRISSVVPKDNSFVSGLTDLHLNVQTNRNSLCYLKRGTSPQELFNTDTSTRRKHDTTATAPATNGIYQYQIICETQPVNQALKDTKTINIYLDHTAPTVRYVNAAKCGTSNLVAKWNVSEDMAGNKINYTYSLKDSQGIVVMEGTTNLTKKYFLDINLVTGEQYTFEIMGTNSADMNSEILPTTVIDANNPLLCQPPNVGVPFIVSATTKDAISDEAKIERGNDLLVQASVISEGLSESDKLNIDNVYTTIAGKNYNLSLTSGTHKNGEWEVTVPTKSLGIGINRFTLYANDSFKHITNRNFNATINDTNPPRFKIALFDSDNKKVTKFNIGNYRVKINSTEPSFINALYLGNLSKKKLVEVSLNKSNEPKIVWEGSFTISDNYTMRNRLYPLNMTINATDNTHPEINGSTIIEQEDAILVLDTRGPVPPVFIPAFGTDAGVTTMYTDVYEDHLKEYDDQFYTKYNSLFVTGIAEDATTVKVYSNNDEAQFSMHKSNELGSSTVMDTIVYSANGGDTKLRFNKDDLDFNIIKANNYIKLDGHSRQNYGGYNELYRIKSVDQSVPGTEITIEPKLEHAVSNGEIVTFYDYQYLPNWFALQTSKLMRGENTIKASSKNIQVSGLTQEYKIFLDNQTPEFISALSPPEGFTVNTKPNPFVLVIKDKIPSSGLINGTLEIRNSSRMIYTTKDVVFTKLEEDQTYYEYRVVFSTSDLPEIDKGNYIADIRVEDKSGNKLIRSYSFGYDTAVPAIPKFEIIGQDGIAILNPNDLYIGQDEDYTYFTNEQKLSFQLDFTSDGYDETVVSIASGTKQFTITPIIPNKKFRVDMIGTAEEGAYNLSIQAKRSTFEEIGSYNFRAVVDRTQPVLRGLSFKSPIHAKNTTVNLNLTVLGESYDYDASLSIGNRSFKKSVSASNLTGFEKLMITKLVEGPNEVELNITDQAGNAATSLGSLMVDNTNPIFTLRSIDPTTKVLVIDQKNKTNASIVSFGIDYVELSNLNYVCYENDKLPGMTCEDTKFVPTSNPFNMNIDLNSYNGEEIVNIITIHGQDAALNNGTAKYAVYTDLAAPLVVPPQTTRFVFSSPRFNKTFLFNENAAIYNKRLYNYSSETLEEKELALTEKIIDGKTHELTSSEFLNAGEYLLNLSYKDPLGNHDSRLFNISVQYNPLVIKLVNPQSTLVAVSTINLMVNTSSFATCKYAATNLTYGQMTQTFDSSGPKIGKEHYKNNFPLAPNGETSVHVRCKTPDFIESYKYLNFVYDPVAPTLQVLFDPSPIADYELINGEWRLATNILVTTNKDSTCRYIRGLTGTWDTMAPLEDNVLGHTKKVVPGTQNGLYNYSFLCKSGAGVLSNLALGIIRIDTGAPLIINITNPSLPGQQFPVSSEFEFKVSTNRLARCNISTNSLHIDTRMSSGAASRDHSILIQTQPTPNSSSIYYVKCITQKDRPNPDSKVANRAIVVVQPPKINSLEAGRCNSYRIYSTWNSEPTTGLSYKYNLKGLTDEQYIKLNAPTDINRVNVTGLSLDPTKTYIFGVVATNSKGVVSQVKEEVVANERPEGCGDEKDFGIELLRPKYGYSSLQKTDLIISTNKPATCKYTTNILQYYSYDQLTSIFGITGGLKHTIINFNITNPLSNIYIKCKDEANIESNHAIFRIYYDPIKPTITSVAFSPATIYESLIVPNDPSNNVKLFSTLNATTNKNAICRYDVANKDYFAMQFNLSGMEMAHTTLVFPPEIDNTYNYFVKCMSLANISSDAITVALKVATQTPFAITDIKPRDNSYWSANSNINFTLATNRNARCFKLNSTNFDEIQLVSDQKGWQHSTTVPSITNEGRYLFKFRCSNVHPVLGTVTNKTANVNVIIDASAPIMKTINASACDKFRIYAKWDATENLSGISYFNYSIEDTNGTKIYNDKTNDRSASITRNNNGDHLNLNSTHTYKLYVTATNGVGLKSTQSQYSFKVNSNGPGCTHTPDPEEVPKCENGIKDTGETDIDCGGSSCPSCAIDEECNNNYDCESDSCVAGRCATDSCANGRQDSQETDVDCGGSKCTLCKETKKCAKNSDCTSSLYCSDDKKCTKHTCTDNIPGPFETDVDCGGNCETKCAINRICKIHDDCKSLYCNSKTKVCANPTCDEDGEVNAGETDVDCGGKCETKCTLGDDCIIDADCTSGYCNNKKCESSEDRDSDKDGMPDWWESEHGLDPNDPNDANLDEDDEGVINLDEFKYKSDPSKPDSDSDGYSDKQEIDSGTDPLDAASYPKSNFLSYLLYSFLILVLLGGGGYVAYTQLMVPKRPTGFRPEPMQKMQQPQQVPSSRMPPRIPPRIPPGMQPRIQSSKMEQPKKKDEDANKGKNENEEWVQIKENYDAKKDAKSDSDAFSKLKKISKDEKSKDVFNDLKKVGKK